ncbi:MAG: DUF6785 family protein [Fimbriimonas sp.]
MSLTDPEAKASEDSRWPGIRFRAFFIAFLATFPVVYATTNAAQSGIFSLMVAPISALLLIILLNAPLRLWLPKAALNQTDLVTIFALVAVAGAVSGEWVGFGHGATYIYPFLSKTNPTYKDQLMVHIPDWLALKDIAQVQDIEGGGRSWQYVITRLPTYFPIWCAWGGLFFSLFLSMQCINSLMRGAWCERERLTFPLIQLPVAMAEGGGAGGMWKSRHMWIAFAVMFSIDILNGFHYLYPSVPEIPVKTYFMINEAFKEPPWSNIGDFRISLYPFMAAIGLFMPSDLLLSFVVFFLLRKATHVVLASNGIPQQTFSGTAIVPGPPYFDEQTWGGVIAMFLGILWVSKDYLREVWSDIRTGARQPDGGVTHRWAFIGLIFGFVIMVGYGLTGGLPVAYLIPYVALFLVFSVVLTRIRAQLGPPTHEFAFFGPNSIMHRFLGNRWLNDKQANYVSEVYLVMNRIYRNHVMPYQLEAMKMAQIEKVNQKRMFQAIAVISVLAFFLAYFFVQVRVYRTGQIGWTEAPGYLNNILNNRKGPDITGIVMTIFGFAMVLLLDLIRFRFPGFPLHPAGYVLSMNYGVDYFWFGLLMALLIKNFVQRYYGLRGYVTLRSIALGILLGEYAAETIWMAMALITKQSTYTISFNDRSLGVQ